VRPRLLPGMFAVMNPAIPRLRSQRFFRAVAFSTFTLAAAGPVRAAEGPTVAKLLAVCDKGFAQGNTGLDAAMCEWYAAPCACRSKHGNAAGPKWCVPATETIDNTVRKVVAELRRYPEDGADANAAVARILTQLYPCRTDSDE
jgi:hypothetical protein